VLREAVISSLLVSAMILVFLGSWRAVIVVSTSIPLSIFVALLGLYVTGQTLNIMTLGGLALAIGMLVDDATVEIENIHRNRSLGKPLTIAILDGAAQIAVPALAATLTICIVFFPVVLLYGPAKYLFTPLALSVVFAMLASYLLSRTLVPTLSRMLLQHEKHDAQGDLNALRERMLERFQEAYGGALRVVLAHRAFVLACGMAIVLLSGLVATAVGTDFFPQVDAGLMRLHARVPSGTRVEQTEQVVAGVERVIRQVIPESELATINDNIGLPLFWNLAFAQTDNIGGADADVLVSLKGEHKATADYKRQLRRELALTFPDVHFYFQAADIVSQVLNFGLAAPIDLEIEGADLQKSAEIARDLRDRIRAIPGAVDVRIAQVLARPALRVEVDRDRAAQMGVTQQKVADNLLISLSSSSLVSPSFWLNPKNNVNYLVVVQAPLPKVESTQDLMAMPVSEASEGGLSPYLGSVASLRPAQVFGVVNHDSVQRVMDVQCGVDGRDLGSVSRDIQKEIDAVTPKLPPGMRMRIRGQSESMNSSFRSLGLGLVLATVLVYFLLVVLFQSWLDPFIIIFAVPGALVGVILILALTHTTINVESLMGSIMAVGVAVSNSILLVNFANDVRIERGLGPIEAALEAGKTRLRPVVMTALAMVLGMLPMALGLGEAGEQNAPLGRAVIGGLVVATVVTLFVVPVVYSLLRRKPPTKGELDTRFAAETQGHVEMPA
jgi:multidrug efflux pump subunit AcrB